MKIFKDQNQILMGVMNITPNSFSDAGLITSHQTFSDQFSSLSKDGADIIDIGAESTAPFNQKISSEEERDRYEMLALPSLINENFDIPVLSFDTYRPETFLFLYKKIKNIAPAARLIWNDVSGIVDENTIDTLKKCPDSLYVFSHNLVMDREETSQHMDYQFKCPDHEIIASVKEYFRMALDEFKSVDLLDRVIFDPCFGFAKNYEQNIILIDKLSDLIEGELMEVPWLLGISRKSFLQKKAGGDLNHNLTDVEKLHEDILFRWFSLLPNARLIIRAHDPKVFYRALKRSVS